MIRSVLADEGRPAPAAFKLLSGGPWEDDYEQDGAVWYCPESIPSEFPIYLLVCMDELPSDCAGPHRHLWVASLRGVSPGFATDESVQSALDSWGGPETAERLLELERDEAFVLALCDVLQSYGCSATFVEKTSRRAKGAFKGAAQEASAMLMLAGFRLDEPANALGNNGWSFLRGTYGWGRREAKIKSWCQPIIDRLNAIYPERAPRAEHEDDE